MKKNIFKKIISTLTAIAVCTSISSFPVFAEERVTSGEESFVSSYEGEAQAVAQYLLDNGCSLEEAKEMMDIYLKGKEQLDSMGKGDMGSPVDIDYYTATCIAPTPHYAAIISIDPTKQLENVKLHLKGVTSSIVAPDKGEYKVCSSYSSALSGISDSLEYLHTDVWRYIISISNVDKLNITTAEPMIIVPLSIGEETLTERSVYRGFEFSYEEKSDNGFYTYETFALGDVNHDGQVNESDATMLVNILSGSDTFKHIYKDSSNHYSGVTNKLASDVNFDGTVDLKDVELIKAYLDGTYNLGDPVPEQTENNALYGDVNGDQNVSLVDVILLNKSIAGTYQIPEGLITSVDVYKDSIIDFVDTTSLLRGMLGLVKLPIIPE